MKKQRYLVLFFSFFILSFNLYAQQWQWGKRAQNQTKEIAVDNNGNTYVLWAIGSQANVDGHAIAGYGYTDIGITSFRCDGTYRWTKVIGTSSPDAGFGLGTDTLGGLYVLGHTSSGNASNLYVDDDTTLSPTMRKILLVKYDTAGNFKWLRMPEPENLSAVTNTAGFNLSIEPNGNIHVMAILSVDAYAEGSYNASFPVDKNIYALKYNKDGAFLGGIHFDITRPAAAGISSYGFNMMYDPVAMHYYWDGIRYDPYTISFGNTAITGSNFLTCFSNTGSVLWVQKSNNDAIPTALTGRPATDNSGNVYVAGYSYNDFDGGIGDGFGNYDFNNTLGVWMFPILVKFNSSGNVLFATNASGNTDNAGLAVSYTNDVIGLAGQYAGGDFNWDGISLGTNNQYYNDFLARFDANTGNIISIDTLYSGQGVNEYPTVLRGLRNGSFYIGGEFDGNVTIAGTTFTKQDGYTDGYIAKFATASCNCVLPVTNFSFTNSGLSYNFNYSGTTPVDSVVWSFGDGHASTGLSTSHSYTANGNYNVCAVAYNDCGSNQYCIEITAGGSGNGVGDLQAFPALTVYPNPVYKKLFINGVISEMTFQLYNSLGVLIKSGSLTGKNAIINMEGIAKGLYILNLKDITGKQGQVKLICP